MKLHLVAAAAALVAAGSANALTPAQIDAARTAGTLKEIYLAGASAQRLFIAGYFQSICKAPSFDVFFNGTGPAPAGSSYRAYSCKLKKTVGSWPVDTEVLLVKRDAGGSFEGVNPVALGTAQTTMLVDGSCTATGNPSPASDILAPSYACNGTTSKLSDAGLSDVEPAMFQKPVNLPDPQVALTTAQLNKLDVATVNQTIFGVAVNKKAYRALQESQGLIGAGDPIDEALAKRPSLNKTWVAGALAGTLSGSTTAKPGWDAVMLSTVDGGGHANRQINVCRRTVGSGTQASFNTYFLNAPGAGLGSTATNGYTPAGQVLNAGKTASVGANVGTIAENGTLAVNLASSSGNLEICLGTTVENAAGTAYGIGLLSRENTPTPTGAIPPVDKGYRFVRIDGVQPQRDFAKIGEYNFVYNATMQYNKDTLVDAAKLAFVKAIRTNAGKSASLNVVDVDTQQGIMAPPATWVGEYDAITDPAELKFASRVDRQKNNSLTELVLVK